MKVQKLNKELLNIYYKNDKKIYAQIVHDKVYVSDSFRVWILNYDDFIIDITKLKTVELARHFNDDGYVPGIKTNELVELKGSIGVYITNEENNLKVLVNQKFLDIFENYTLKIKGQHDPVFVYENDEVVGLVLPMRKY